MSFGTTGLRSSIHSTGSRTNTIGIPGTGLSYIDRSRGRKRKKGSSGRSQSPNQDMTKNAAAVEQYNHYIHAMTNLHQISPHSKNWEEIERTPAPFSPEDMGPREKEAVHQYHQYEPNFVERLFKRLAHKKRKELTQAIKQAREQDEAGYRKWQEATELASEVLRGNPEAYARVVKESSDFDHMRKRSKLQ